MNDDIFYNSSATKASVGTSAATSSAESINRAVVPLCVLL